MTNAAGFDRYIFSGWQSKQTITGHGRQAQEKRIIYMSLESSQDVLRALFGDGLKVFCAVSKKSSMNKRSMNDE